MLVLSTQEAQSHKQQLECRYIDIYVDIFLTTTLITIILRGCAGHEVKDNQQGT